VIRRRPSQLRRARNPTCGAPCRDLVRGLVTTTPRRAGGRTLRDGYAYVKVPPGDPLANSAGYAPEHKVVARSVLGRALAADERVVRTAYRRDDNAPETLVVTSPRGSCPLLELARRERAAS